MSSRPNSRDRGVDQTLDRVDVGQVGGHHDRAASQLADLRRHLFELRHGAGGDHDVGAGLGERQRGGGADAPPGGGDDGDAVVETEAVDQHAGTLPGRYVARMTAPTVDDHPTTDQLDALYDALRNWGRWGDDDELGALNFLTPERRAAAGALVRTGVTVSLAHDFPVTPSPETPEPRAPPHAGRRRRPGLERHPGLRGEPRLHRHRGARDGHHPPRRAVPHVRAGRDVQRPARRRREEHRRAHQHGDEHRRRPRRPGRVPRHPPRPRRRAPRRQHRHHRGRPRAGRGDRRDRRCAAATC